MPAVLLRSKRFFSSLRGRMLLIVLLALAAPVALLVHIGSIHRGMAVNQARADVLQLSHLGAHEHEHQVTDVLQGVATLSGTVGAGQDEPDACERAASQALSSYPLLANLAIARPDGTVVCSAAPPESPAGYADRDWFQKILLSKIPVVGDYTVDPTNGQPALALAVPIVDTEGQLLAVAVGSLKLDWLAPFVENPSDIPDSALAILDGTGRALFTLPDSGSSKGAGDRVASFAATIRNAAEQGMAGEEDVGGEERIYAYTRLHDVAGEEPRYLTVSVPLAAIYAQADRELGQSMLLVVPAVLLAISMAWWAGHRLVMRHLQALLRATGRLQQGDLMTRLGPPYGAGELGEITQAFDSMAEALAAREAERRRAEDEVWSLNQELEQRVEQRTAQLEIYARRLATVNAIGQALTATLDLDCVMDVLLEAVTQTLQTDAAGVALIEQDEPGRPARLGDDVATGNERPLVFLKAIGPLAEGLVGLRVAADESLAWQAMRMRGPAVLRCGYDSPGLAPWESTRAGSPNGGQAICIAFMANERAIGVLELWQHDCREFAEDDSLLLQAVAAQATIAIENAMLYRKEREQYRRLEESQALLVQAEKSAALGHLAAGLAHEINNPLQSLRGHIELVTDFPLRPEERAANLRTARQELVRLSEITHRVLNFYRPSQLVRQPVNAGEVVERTLLLARKQLDHAHIEVSCSLEELPVIQAVPDQLMQVFLNVVVNAIYAMGDGGHLRVVARAMPDHIAISFANDGPTIPAEDLPKIFDPFFTTKPGGTGLGLSIARSIIAQHGGTMSVESESGGRGVVFTIRLPLITTAAAKER